MDNGERIKMIKNIARLNAEVEHIKEQVTNHLPTAIDKLKIEVTESHNAMDKRFTKIELKMAYWSGAIVVGMAVLQIFINKFF